MNTYFFVGGVVICIIVLLSCICRVNLLKLGRHRTAWGLLYIGWAVFAAGMLLDLLNTRDIDWWVCLGVGCVALQLLLTSRDWRGSAPRDLEKAT